MNRCLLSLLLFFGTSLLGVIPASRAEMYQEEIHFSVNDLRFEKCSGHDLVFIKDAGHTNTIGAPSLPLSQINVAIPTDAVVHAVRVLDITSVDIKGHYDILPTTEPLPMDNRSVADPMHRDPAIYDRDAAYPGRYCEILNGWELVGQDFVTLCVYPVQYNPVSKKLALVTRIRFEMIYEESASPARETFNFSEKVKYHYTRYLRSLAIIPEDGLRFEMGRNIIRVPPQKEKEGPPGYMGILDEVPDLFLIISARVVGKDPIRVNQVGGDPHLGPPIR